METAEKTSEMKKLRFFLCAFSLITVFPLIAFGQFPGQHPKKMAVKLKVHIAVYSFNLNDVRLLDSPFKDNMERDAKWILSIRNDRLLKSFHINAGMRASAKSLGGWESLDSELRGHITGHIMSALALLYASTGDTVYKNKGESLVAGLAQVQKVLNQGGYLSAFPQYYIDRCMEGKPVWAPWYTLHKIMAGLIDMYWYANDQQALDVAKRMSNWAYNKLSPLTPKQLTVMLRNEFGGMNEAFYNLYAITGNPKDLKLAEMFYNKKILNPLAEHVDDLPGLHANTQIPKVIGEARGYELTDNPKYKTIATYFWNTVINTQAYATGGNSDHEHFVKTGTLADHLTGYTQETCNTYNMLKLTRHLFSWSGNEEYMDYYERALYNDILPQQDPQSSMICYFTPLVPGAFKVYSTRYQSFWCDVGTGFENHARYAESIYYHDNKGVYVTLFIPSVLNWKKKGITVRQETKYPESQDINLTIETKGMVSMPLHIRYPYWVKSGAIIKVNGRKIRIRQHPGSFIIINRRWHNGDKVKITYPMSLHLMTLRNDSKVAALVYGPLVLAAPMGKEGIVPPAPFSDPTKHNDYYTYNYHIPGNIPDTLQTGGNKVSEWVKLVSDSKEFAFEAKDANTGKEIRLVPFYKIHRGRYVVYWRLK